MDILREELKEIEIKMQSEAKPSEEMNLDLENAINQNDDLVKFGKIAKKITVKTLKHL